MVNSKFEAILVTNKLPEKEHDQHKQFKFGSEN